MTGARLRRLGSSLGIGVLLVHATCVYLAFYTRGDCDDKAVHYYSAAAAFADRASRDEVRRALPLWLERLEPSEWSRFASRIRHARNYLASDALTALVRRLGRGRALSYTTPLKAAFLTLYVAALLWLWRVCRRRPLLMAAVLTALAWVALRRWPLPMLADLPRKDMSPFIYVPRGSAAILVMAMLAAAAQARYGLFLATVVLAALWHAGQAAVAVPAVLGSALVGAVVLRLGVRSSAASEVDLRAVAVLAGFAIAAGLAAASPAVAPVAQLVAPIALAILGRRAVTRAFADERCGVFWVLLCAYLTVSQALALTLANAAVMRALAAFSGSPAVMELPLRLAGSRYWAAVLVALLLACGLAAEAAGAVAIRLRARRAPMTAAVVAAGAILAAAPLAGIYGDIIRGRANFFRADCARVAPAAGAAADLTSLDPRDSTAFFLALGDRLFARR